MSWIRSLDDDFDRDVSFYYSCAREAEALHLDEIERAGTEHPTFVPHIVVTERDGFLTADQAVAGKADLDHISVYMCGPPPMTKALGAGFRRLGIPRAHVRWEEFAAR